MKKKRDHKTRPGAQSIPKSICDQKGCKFFGDYAQQGVCYTSNGDLIDWAKLDENDKRVVAELKAMKKREGKAYVASLEANYMCAILNWQLTLDECIRLRRDLALKTRK